MSVKTNGHRKGPGRPCTVCEHPARAQIDDDLACGVRFRAIASRYSLASHENVRRHAASHLAADLAPAAQDDIFTPEGLRKALRGLTERMTRLCDEIEVSDPKDAHKPAATLLQCLKLAGQITGELSTTEARLSNAQIDGLAGLMRATAELQASLLASLGVGVEQLQAWREATPGLVRQAAQATGVIDTTGAEQA